MVEASCNVKMIDNRNRYKCGLPVIFTRIFPDRKPFSIVYYYENQFVDRQWLIAKETDVRLQHSIDLN